MLPIAVDFSASVQGFIQINELIEQREGGNDHENGHNAHQHRADHIAYADLGMQLPVGSLLQALLPGLFHHGLEGLLLCLVAMAVLHWLLAVVQCKAYALDGSVGGIPSC